MFDKSISLCLGGADCTDKVSNCFGSYGDDVCTGTYKPWAQANCMKSCGVCWEVSPGWCG